MSVEINKKPNNINNKKSFKGKTKTGFKYEVFAENADNYELLEALAELETDASVTPKVVNLFLGKKEANCLKEHVRSESGVVSVTQMMGELKEIFESISETKNS